MYKQTFFKKVRLDQIKIDIQFVPACLETSLVQPDKLLIKSHEALLSSGKYQEPLRVGLLDGVHYLLPPYEAYKALELSTSAGSYVEADCLVIMCLNKKEMLSLAIYLSNCQGVEPSHIQRLLTYQLMQSAGLSNGEIRYHFRGTMNDSAFKRQFQRDIRLLNHPKLLQRVIGVSKNGEPSPLIAEMFLKRSAADVDMTAKQAEKYLSKLRNDSEIVDKFLEAFDEEKDHIIRTSSSADEETKPFYKRKAFDPARILSIAEKIAAGNGYLPNEEEEKSDNSWHVDLVEELGVCSFEAGRVSLYDSNPKNLKIMFSMAYMMMATAEALFGHIARIRPNDHGESLKVKRSDLKPSVMLHSNHPDLRDISYLKKVREHKFLLYCDRQKFMRTMRIAPANFGFDSYKWDSISNYKRANEYFQDWWENDFLKEIRNWFSGDSQRHPLFNYYSHIKSYLNLQANSGSNADFFWSDFFTQMFSYVLRKIDEDAESTKRHMKILESTMNQHISDNWDSIKRALRSDDISETEKEEVFSKVISTLINEKISGLQKDFTQTVSIQTQKISEQNYLIQDLLLTPKSNRREGSDIVDKLKDFYG